ncbi:coniferyl aldehyde dehydrogenase [Gramella sp. BOM4]|nr:coniferyl aldehyde dehydrogenase [Christiangramia bathymodioli]
MNRLELKNILREQQAAFKAAPPDYKKRMESLKQLEEAVEKYKDRLIKAVSADFGLRAEEETLVLEIFPLHDQIRHAMSHLKTWMRRQSVSSSWFLLPSSAYYQYQPLGSVGIMGAWNYQVLLTLSPLVDAIAAGNHAVLKPSEIAPGSAEVIKELINSTFPKEYIHCVTGNAELAQDFSSMPWDHLFFTGSTNVGKKVMAAAAPNLTPVTLELGGKSPAIIHEKYDLKKAVSRILAGKLLNSGQTCVATDYVIMPASLNSEFEKAAREKVNSAYPKLAENDQYTQIISNSHYDRLQSLLGDAREKGARIVELSEEPVNSNQKMSPKLLFDVGDEMKIMQEEIFGPILPVVNLPDVASAIEYVNDKPKPLALYYFDSNRRRIDHLLKHTLSGGVCINDTIFHLAQHNLPFGGVGNSGMGHYHGFDGFKTFSKKRAVMHQKSLAASDMLHPPFSGFKKKLIDLMGKLSRL